MTPRKSVWVRILLYSGVLGLAGKAMQFLALTMLAYILLPVDFGRFAVAQIAVTGGVGVVSSSFAIAANKQAAIIASTQNDVLGNPVAGALGVIWKFRRNFIITLAASGILMPIAYAAISGEGFQLWTLGLGLAAASIVVIDVLSGALAGLGAIRRSAVLDAARATTSGLLCLLGGLAGSFRASAYGLVAGDLVLTLIVVMLAGRQAGAIRSDAPHFDRAIWAGLVSNASAQIATWVVAAAVQTYAGLAAVGAFGVANRFATLVLLAPGLMSKNWLGELTRVSTGSAWPSVRRAVGTYSLVVLMLVVFAGGMVVAMVKFVFAELALRYDGLWSILTVLIIFASVRAIATALGVVLVAWDQLTNWVVSDLLALVVSLIMVAGGSSGGEVSLTFFGGTLLAGAVVCAVVRIVGIATEIRKRSLSCGLIGEGS